MYTFGIIGGGMIAEFHAQAIQAMGENVKLGAIYARNPEKAKRLGEQFNCKSFSDLDDFLGDPSIDIVTIATPSGAHLEPAIAAARAKKHIICEKPLEVTPARVQQMIDVAKKEQVVLSGIFNRRFNPAMEQFKLAVENQRFGTLTLCDAQIKWHRTQAYYDSAAWRGTIALDGGGALMNQAIHTVDLLLYLVGKVKRISASMALLTHKNIEVEDTAVAILEFENGAKGTIQAATSCWSSTGHPAEIQLCGSHGSVILSDESFRVWDFVEKKEQDIYVHKNLMIGNQVGMGANDPKVINITGHLRNFENVISAIEQNVPPFVSGEEAMKPVQLIDAIYRSAKSDGEWIIM
ncbi:MAG: oxidoreductase [Saprospiraceae bacterium]|nr:MAG: oxidoreductase [Saprospiraceae bacterium]